MTTTSSPEGGWAPAACTLPTVEQPLQLAELDMLFAHNVTDVRAEGGHRVTLTLVADPHVAGTAAELAARETGCCSFFAFDLRLSEGTVLLSISVGDENADVLAALAGRARAVMSGAA